MNMRLVKNYYLLFLLLTILQSGTLLAAESDLSGWWESVIDDGFANLNFGKMELKQTGSKVIGKQESPEIAAFLGENRFEGDMSGNKIKGKFATIIEGENAKETCGKNWAQWSEFELVLSPDGNRLEGKWLQHHSNINVPGCPRSPSDQPVWKPMTFTRTTPPLDVSPLDQEAGPTNKDYLMGALSLFGVSIVSFFIRNAYANYLVSNFKRSPNNAGLAGWGIFGGLIFGSAIGSIALVSKNYLTLPVVASLSSLSILCLLICALVSSKK
jgi:hypothetical protein